ncbi:MAG TPA: hypothetical protein VM491_03885 [Burkholderiaceae bacterium]|nr:hypothetical protein [Burkholderiaceae bacterium]
MLDARHDQAAGLRRAFRRDSHRVLPVLGAHEHRELFARLATAARPHGLRLLPLPDDALLRGEHPASVAAAVVTGCGADEIATAYARLKLLAGGERLRAAIAVFDWAAGARAVQQGHRRLADTAERFLRLRVALAGVAAARDDAPAFRALAQALADWAAEDGRDGRH